MGVISLKASVKNFGLYMFFVGVCCSIYFVYSQSYLISIGFTGKEIGIYQATTNVISILSMTFWMYLCDYKKTIKKIIFYNLIVSSVLSVIIFLVPNKTITVVVMLIFVFFQFSIIMLSENWALYSGKKISEKYGVVRAATSIGFGVSALFVGFILKKISEKWIFLIYPIMALVAYLFSRSLIDVAYEGKEKSGKKVNIKELKGNYKFIFLVIVLMLVIITQSIFSFLPMIVISLKGSTSQLGIITLLFTIFELPVFLFANKILKKFSKEHLLVFAMITMTLRMILLFFATNVTHLLLITVTQLTGFPLLLLTSKYMVAEAVPEELKNSAQGIVGTAQLITSIIFSVSAGFLIDAFTIKSLYVIGFVVGSIAIFLSYFYVKKYKTVELKKAC